MAGCSRAVSASPPWLAYDREHVWHPYSSMVDPPPVFPVIGAAGTRIQLADGRELIDGMASWWSAIHGYKHPRLNEAVRVQLDTMAHVMFGGLTHEGAVDLARQLISLAPAGLEHVFFSDSGSVAVEVAIKMALQYRAARGEPQRRLLSLRGGYHGDTFGAMSVGDPDPFFLPFAPLLFESRRVPAELEALESALDELGDRCAGFILEPLVQGAAGMHMHSVEFLQGARRATAQRGIPLIADEVMTGFGRTGSLFACRKADIAPDLLCIAKGLTGGMLPLAATMATEELFELFLSENRGYALFHGHTFTAHPIGCAVALASLEVNRAEDTPARLDHIGQVIEAALTDELGEESELIRGLRRTGGIVAFDLVGDDEGYFTSKAPALRAESLA
ncbi:MAG: adenosylmethionine--8-amino-7-oxononanoate transaminase, partial [Gammaproteobacteria bacterium]